MDRIDDAYNGRLGEAFMRRTHERLHWICANVDGVNVLDVGCSQGTLARLLAPMGKIVLGVDLNQDAISFAREKMSELDALSRGRLRFEAANFIDFKSEARFDTVVMGEILEHLPCPAAFVRKAWECLSDGGTYVVTVPFGINDDPDHKQTFYWTWIREIIAPYFDVREVKFFGRWIGVVGVRRDSKAEAADMQQVPFSTVKDMEKAFYGLQRRIIDNSKARGLELRGKVESSAAKVGALNAKLAAAQGELASKRAEAEKLAKEKDVLTERVKTAGALRQARYEQDKQLIRECSALKAKVASLETDLKKAESRYLKLALSKLGRITLWYWKHKDALELRLRGGKSVASRELPKGDEGFFARVADKIKDMPVSNGCRYYEKLNRRIGVVCDRFYWDSVKAAADFVYIDPTKWQDCIKDIDCLLMVSAWQGLDDGTDWRNMSHEGSESRTLAYEIVDTCKGRGIPTIFYSKEDPPNYAMFLGLAKRCDYVFTSDDGCVPRYREDCGHERVFPLRFCINPTYHNPVGSRHCAKERNVFFAGSWIKKYPERCQDMECMLDGVLDAGRGLNIVDRCYDLRGRPDGRYAYPEKYLRFLAPAVDHDLLQKIHKLYDWCININTVKDSATMFANRVYELQANGNLLISNYSLGVSNRFPNVFLVHDRKEVGTILNGFTDDEIYERQAAGVRQVMTGETCYDRVAELLQVVGLAEPPPVRKVLVIATKATDRVKEMFELQTYGAKELTDFDHVTPELYAGADIVAFFDADADYGAYYLEDMVNGFKYTNCDYVTKAAYVNAEGELVGGKEHDYVAEFADRTRTVFWREAFTLEELLGATGDVRHENGYAADHFNYALRPRVRSSATRPTVSVVIPVYNNGQFLYGRAFAALRRSSLFPRMEIIIVDDGSTDGRTPKVARELERRYPNVRTFCFQDGGSGSASRPRNKGVELAEADWIVFHDPDNEAINDGYAKLLAEAIEADADIALGNTLRIGEVRKELNYYRKLVRNGSKSVTVIHGGCDILKRTSFSPANIQGMIIRKKLLQEFGLSQVVGGAGQDSLLCQQMFACAGTIAVTPYMIQVYFAEREFSIVNSITPRFYEKYLLTERARVDWLISTGFMDDYMSLRFATYVTGWYFEKLCHVKPELADECVRKLFGLLRLYDGHYKGGRREIDEFLTKCRAGDFHGAYEFVLASRRE